MSDVGRIPHLSGLARAWGARMGRWCRTREGPAALAVLAVGLLIRCALAPYHGFFGDLTIYASWGQDLARHPLDFYSFYPRSTQQALVAVPGWPTDMPANYPPLSIYLFWAEMRLYSAGAALTGTTHPQPILLPGPVLSPLCAVCMKVATLAADVATGVLLYVLARRARGPRWALGLAALYAFLPAVLLDGALWGQTDGVISLLVVLALLCALRHRPVWAGALFAAAVTFKPQPILFAPVLVVYLLRWAGWRAAGRFVIAGAATALAVCLPYLLPPRLEILAMARNLATFHEDYASPTAFNLWWLSARFHSATSPYLGPLSPAAIGVLLFAPVCLFVLRRTWRDASAPALFFSAGLLALASWDLTTMQYDRYLYPAIVFFLVAAAWRPRVAWLAAAVSVTLFANVGIITLLNLQERPQIDGGFWTRLPNVLYWPWAITLLICAANLALLAVGLASSLPRRATAGRRGVRLAALAPWRAAPSPRYPA